MRASAAATGRLARAIRIAGAVLGLLLALARSDRAAALNFTCIEPSRYKNLMQVFNDNPSTLIAYFALDRSRLLDINACRALLLSGTINPGDSEALLDQVIRNKGWLAVLYLSFDGVHLGEEIKFAQVIRAFSLKTRVLLGPSLRYDPDFASPWDAPPLMNVGRAIPEAFEVSAINKGTQAFARRGDLDLPLGFDGNACLGSCIAAWSAGVNRLISPLPPVAFKSFAGPVPEIVWAPAQAALAASLDGVKVAPPTAPALVPAALPSALPTAPPAMQRLLREKCGAFLAATDAVVDRVARDIREAGRTGFHDISIEQYKVGSEMVKSLISDFDTLDQAGARQQRCLAQAYEAERMASFDRQCAGGCDKAKLVQAFERRARAFIDGELAFAKLFGNAGNGDIGQQWEEQEGPRGEWHGSFARRATSNVFDATFANGKNQLKATFEIGRSSDRVFAVRSQAEGRCLYQGAVNGAAAAGTYVCTWSAGVFAWSATVAAAQAPLQDGRTAFPAR